MNRDEALKLVKAHVKNRNLIKHMLAVEAGMQALAPRHGGDPQRWALAGLIHDLDYEQTKDDPQQHGLRTVDLLRERGLADEEMLEAILAHAGHRPPSSAMGQALCAVDPLSGLIVASALVHPEGLGGLSGENVLNRFREKGFARSASREGIATCQELGMELSEFVGAVLAAMQEIGDDLGL